MIVLSLILAAAASAADPSAASLPSPANAEKLICKKEEVTGSLARRIRTCHTAAQWRALQDDARAAGERVLDQGAICGECLKGG